MVKCQPSIENVDDEVPPNTEITDDGLFIITRGKCEGVEVYALNELHGSLQIMPKYHINTNKISMDTLKLYPNREIIYFSYVKDQKLIIKSWNFKRQNMADIVLPSKVQHLKPRLTNAVRDTFFVTEEKYMTWPSEGYKTTVCRFGLASENYKCLELNCGGIKEILGLGDEIFVFNQKAEMFSFNVHGGKRMSKTTLNHNGILKAVVFNGKIYVACYIRSKCTIFVEQLNAKANKWITVIVTMTFIWICFDAVKHKNLSFN